MTRIVHVPMESWERAALQRLARRERREPAQQAAVLLRQALERAGALRTLTVEEKSEMTTEPQEA